MKFCENETLCTECIHIEREKPEGVGGGMEHLVPHLHVSADGRDFVAGMSNAIEPHGDAMVLCVGYESVAKS